MLIFKQDKLVFHLWEKWDVDVEEKSRKHPYTNYAVYITLQVNWVLKDIRTVLWVRENWTFEQENFISVVNVLNDIWYNISWENMNKIYKQIKY